VILKRFNIKKLFIFAAINNETSRRKLPGIFLTDGLTRQLRYFRLKGRGINPTKL